MSSIARNLPASCIGRQQLTVVRETGAHKVWENNRSGDARKKLILIRRHGDVAKEIRITVSLVEVREKNDGL